MPIVTMKRYSRQDVRSRPGDLFVFGDNLAERGGEPDAQGRSNPRAGQAAACRNEPNAVGIPTKRAPSMRPGSFFTDDDLNEVRPIIQDRFRRLADHLRKGGTVVWPEDGIGSGRANVAATAPAIAAYLAQCEAHLRASYNGENPFD